MIKPRRNLYFAIPSANMIGLLFMGKNKFIQTVAK